MKKSFLLIAVVAISMFFIAGSAFATTLVDFNYPGIGGTKYVVTDLFPGVDMTINAYSYGKDWELTWDASDNGIGINDDEVSGGYIDGNQWELERLRFSFSKTMNIDEFYIVDLFDGEGPNGEAETGRYRIQVNGQNFGGNFGPGTGNGDYTLVLGAQVDQITFFADDNSFKDFAVAGFKGEPVPEPGTIVLLGLGLVGVAAYRRKARS